MMACLTDCWMLAALIDGMSVMETFSVVMVEII
jgi:hypothetical protein